VDYAQPHKDRLDKRRKSVSPKTIICVEDHKVKDKHCQRAHCFMWTIKVEKRK